MTKHQWGDKFVRSVKDRKFWLLLGAILFFVAFLLIEHFVILEKSSISVSTSEQSDAGVQRNSADSSQSEKEHPSDLYLTVLETAGHVTRDISISLLVAFILLIAIESAHRKHLDDSFEEKIERIGLNVFNGVFNTQMPPEYVTKVVNDMFRINLVRDQFAVDYIMEEQETKKENGESITFVTLESHLSYNVVNIGLDDAEFNVALSLPDPRLRELQSFVQIKGVRINNENILEETHRVRLRESLGGKTPQVAIDFGSRTLTSGESARVDFVYVMAKEAEDTEILRTSLPAREVKITLTVKRGDFDIFADSIQSGGLKDLRNSDFAQYAWQTSGYVLPWQGILFWWKHRKHLAS